ncbi:hypothetical protein DW194_04505 [Subdoligranulum sp. AM16-9]|jgi:hypothetical protein|nr:hypothetical protein DW194_04505 [Subdoligranulum sp. AM16-9]
MSVTYGFYNSINGDRKYNALEMSSIFDGIIVDGVYMSIGDALNVKSSGGMGITVGTGRAWFNHTWTLNDSVMPLTIESSDVLLNRIDAVVLEVNNDSDVRKNTIKIVKGSPASKPVKPSLIESELVNQHPLAYITIGKGVPSISQSNIENAVGTSACPYVTGVLKGMDIDKLVAQWGAQWAEWLSSNTDAWEAFMSDNTNEWKSFMAKNKNEWSDLINGNTSEFETWFEHMKDQLSEDAAGNLQLQVDNLNNAALGGDFVLKGSSVSAEYMGANRIAAITAYGENAQGGTTEAPVMLTGVDSVQVCGNNLLPKAMETKTVYGVTFTPNPNGSISVSGTATDNSSYNFADGLDRVLLGRTVCVSGGSMQTQVIINEKTASGTFKRNVIINAKTPTAVGVLSKQADDNTLYATIYVPTGTTVNTTIYPMLNLGNTAMPYEPYQGSVTQLPIPLPLHEVGDVRDVCRTRVKSVYDKRVVLDGSSDEVFIQTNIIDGWIQIATESDAVIPESTSIVGSIKSSYLKAYAIEEVYSKKYSGISVDSNRRIRLSFKTSEYPDVTSVETARTYLSAHPLTVYYQSTAYNGTNGLDVCLTEYQTGYFEVDETEAWQASSQTSRMFFITRDNISAAAAICSNFNFSAQATTEQGKFYIVSNQIRFLTSYETLESWKNYLAAQKEAGTPVQIAYQLATPETYATDPVDFDNAAGPVTIVSGGELKVGIRNLQHSIDELETVVDGKAPKNHASTETTYGAGNATKYGHLKLSDAIASGSNADQGIAATPSAVNQVHAKANAAQSTANAAMPKAGGTFTGTVAAKTENIAGAYIRNISVQNSASQLQYTNFIIMVRK